MSVMVCHLFIATNHPFPLLRQLHVKIGSASHHLSVALVACAPYIHHKTILPDGRRNGLQPFHREYPIGEQVRCYDDL